jgi:Domain of unknown function (DUF4365)
VARQPHPPGKRRTRQHVIADLSENHVARVVLAEGFTVQKLVPDYGCDLSMMTYDDEGYVEPGFVLFQLKASESLARVGENYVFDLDVRDYNHWQGERLPILLVLFDATLVRAFWVHTQDYFADPRHRPRTGARTVRVRVPCSQVFNRRAVVNLRRLKEGIRLRLLGARDD